MRLDCRKTWLGRPSACPQAHLWIAPRRCRPSADMLSPHLARHTAPRPSAGDDSPHLVAGARLGMSFIDLRRSARPFHPQLIETRHCRPSECHRAPIWSLRASITVYGATEGHHSGQHRPSPFSGRLDAHIWSLGHVSGPSFVHSCVVRVTEGSVALQRARRPTSGSLLAGVALQRTCSAHIWLVTPLLALQRAMTAHIWSLEHRRGSPSS